MIIHKNRQKKVIEKHFSNFNYYQHLSLLSLFLINHFHFYVTAVVLEHVKDLKPVQQAIQNEARKYLTRSQLNRQNRNYIYQSSTKTNRRRNLQRNHSGANNNRKCCQDTTTSIFRCKLYFLPAPLKKASESNLKGKRKIQVSLLGFPLQLNY